MPIYGTRKFSGLLVSGLVIGLVITAFVGWGLQSLFSTHLVRAYYQLVSAGQPTTGKPMPHRWASINHTLVVLDTRNVVSILTITAEEAPFNKNNTVKIDFDDPYTYSSNDPAPTVLEGNQSWSGIFDTDLTIGQTIIIWTRLRFDSDATYFVGGRVLSYSCDVERPQGYIVQGYGTFYYVTVEQGKITEVTDEQGMVPSSTQVEVVNLGP